MFNVAIDSSERVKISHLREKHLNRISGRAKDRSRSLPFALKLHDILKRNQNLLRNIQRNLPACILRDRN